MATSGGRRESDAGPGALVCHYLGHAVGGVLLPARAAGLAAFPPCPPNLFAAGKRPPGPTLQRHTLSPKGRPSHRRIPGRSLRGGQAVGATAGRRSENRRGSSTGRATPMGHADVRHRLHDVDVDAATSHARQTALTPMALTPGEIRPTFAGSYAFQIGEALFGGNPPQRAATSILENRQTRETRALASFLWAGHVDGFPRA
ncbi:hypothetical protein HPB47_012357 [Ixodes persulcatus]|uniref:Uncharacterized protein n=1 Tax=Ixodes persulcatus TaxID=34615 RepID=A0AC60NTV2_IXOPE|nr:hypothetical protein HPB47_012357 [Ixodes persulcatus]